MVKDYTCEKCGKIFTQKGHYSNHLNRKRPCKKVETVSLKKEVQKKLNELSQSGDIVIKNKNLITNDPDTLSTNMDIQNKDGIQYLSEIDDNSIDLVLTDPPYITSSETGMGNLHKQIQENKAAGKEFVCSEEEWNKVLEELKDKEKRQVKQKEKKLEIPEEK